MDKFWIDYTNRRHLLIKSWTHEKNAHQRRCIIFTIIKHFVLTSETYTLLVYLPSNEITPKKFAIELWIALTWHPRMKTVFQTKYVWICKYHVLIFKVIHCDAIRSEYFLTLCRLTSLLTLVVCSWMLLRISFKNSTSSAIAMKYPYLDEIYFAFFSLKFKFFFKTTIPLKKYT